LKGIGLVSAFKKVLDSAYRPPNTLFHEILSTLPSKFTKGIGNRAQYADCLAQSEAVFYYHVVLDNNGACTTLLSPRKNGDGPNHANEYYPDLTRFKGGFSFLGDEEFLKNLSEALNDDGCKELLPQSRTRPPLAEIKGPLQSRANTADTEPLPTNGKSMSLGKLARRSNDPPLLEIHLRPRLPNRISRRHERYNFPDYEFAEGSDCRDILSANGINQAAPIDKRRKVANKTPEFQPEFGLGQFAFQGERQDKPSFPKEKSTWGPGSSPKRHAAFDPLAVSSAVNSGKQETLLARELLHKPSGMLSRAKELKGEARQSVGPKKYFVSSSYSSTDARAETIQTSRHLKGGTNFGNWPVNTKAREPGKLRSEASNNRVQHGIIHRYPYDATDSSLEDPHEDPGSRAPERFVQSHRATTRDKYPEPAFDNPAATSNYFDRKRSRGRRVTLEVQDLPRDAHCENDSIDDYCEIMETHGVVDQGCGVLSQFDYGRVAKPSCKRPTYDDFLSSSDEIDPPQSYSQPRVQTNFKSQPFRNPKIKPSRQGGPLMAAFEHQQQLYGNGPNNASDFPRKKVRLAFVKSITKVTQHSLLDFPGFNPIPIKVHMKSDDF
jgi:hypothetical protein